MLPYIDNVILSYANKTQEELPLDWINQKAIAIFDYFATYWTDSLLEKFKSRNIQPLFVPATRTDMTVNNDYKMLKEEFREWYSAKVLKSRRMTTIPDLRHKSIRKRLL